MCQKKCNIRNLYLVSLFTLPGLVMLLRYIETTWIWFLWLLYALYTAVKFLINTKRYSEVMFLFWFLTKAEYKDQRCTENQHLVWNNFNIHQQKTNYVKAILRISEIWKRSLRQISMWKKQISNQVKPQTSTHVKGTKRETRVLYVYKASTGKVLKRRNWWSWWKSVYGKEEALFSFSIFL